MIVGSINAHPAGDVGPDCRLLVLRVLGERLRDDLIKPEGVPTVPPFQTRKGIEDSISTRRMGTTIALSTDAATAPDSGTTLAPSKRSLVVDVWRKTHARGAVVPAAGLSATCRRAWERCAPD